MYTISELTPEFLSEDTLVFIPFTTFRKTSPPKVPESLKWVLPNADETLSKYSPRNTYYYSSGGVLYMFHRVKASSKSAIIDMSLVDAGIDSISEEFSNYSRLIIFASNEVDIDEYIKLVFKNNNSVYLYKGN